ncbi:MAG TPA: hypothetical protein VKE91_09555 [Blastocatellia bacterium]|nr:hypothetical protein [Blastocatellia bacterium]
MKRLRRPAHNGREFGTLDYDGVRYVNACICDGSYRPVNPPVVVDLEVVRQLP